MKKGNISIINNYLKTTKEDKHIDVKKKLNTFLIKYMCKCIRV